MELLEFLELILIFYKFQEFKGFPIILQIGIIPIGVIILRMNSRNWNNSNWNYWPIPKIPETELQGNAGQARIFQ